MKVINYQRFILALAKDLEMVFDDWQGSDYGALYTLPTYTAVAWYHKVLPDPPSDIGPLMKEVSDFALGEYSKALARLRGIIWLIQSGIK